jgi:hypothetical protein
MNPQAFNRYSYVINNPLKYIDPTGRQWDVWAPPEKLIDEGLGFELDDPEIDDVIDDLNLRNKGGTDPEPTSPEWKWDNPEANAAFALTLLLLADDITGVGIVDDLLAAGFIVIAVHSTVEANRDYIKGKISDALDVAVSWATRKDAQKANDIIEKEKKGSINREFPSEWRDKTYGEIKDAAKKGVRTAQKAKKLLDDKRFNK